MDKDTLEIFQEGQRLSDFTKSQDWAYIKQKFTEKILDLQSTRNVTKASHEQMGMEVDARNLAGDYLMDLLRDIEGRVDQHQANKSLIDPVIQNF